ncbi:MAG: SPOR domain-containing protein, partial [Gemmatimonadota bacterium]
GESWLAEGDLEEAFAAFRDGFARMKDYQRRGGQGASLREIEGEYVYWLGRTLLARGAYGDARKYLNLLLLDYPGHPLEPLALYHLSESFRQDDERREAEQTWRRFGESVRNTSLESVSENPNLVAVARAREAGELYRPPEAGEENGAAERGSAGDFAPAPDEGLRAPEPGRPGGIVEDRPVGRTVEADVDGRVESRRDRLEEEVPETAEAARDPQPEEPAEDLPRAGEGPPAAGAPPAAVETPPDALGRRAEIIEEGRAAAGETVSGVEALEEPGAEAEEPPALEPIPPGTVFLQVGAFTSAEAASRLSSSLRKRGFEPALHSGLVNGQGYYRVRFGPYQVPGDRPRLESIRNALAAGGFEAVVMRPDPGE